MRKNSVYTPHPGFAMEESSLATLKERTGRPLEEWIRIVKKSGPATERERIAWLKDAHGITTNYALWIAKRADGGGGAADYDPDALVEAMFAGKKAVLRPIYDEMLRLAFGLGELAGCDDSVGMRDSVEHRGGLHLSFFVLIAIAGIEWGTVCVGQFLEK